jgi:hypothetical protein
MARRVSADVLVLLAFAAAWFVLSVWVLPKFGAPP